MFMELCDHECLSSRLTVWPLAAKTVMWLVSETGKSEIPYIKPKTKHLLHTHIRLHFAR